MTNTVQDKRLIKPLKFRSYKGLILKLKEDYKKLIRMTYDYLYMNIPEKYGKIQITNAPYKIVCKEVHNIYKNSHSYCTPGYGKKFSLTKVVLTVLKINKDAIFTELK